MIFDNYTNISESHLENVYNQYISFGHDKFMELVLSSARKNMVIHNDIDLKLLQMSFSIVKKARNIERDNGGKRCDEWRDLATLLRKIAHKIHRECKVKSNHKGFLTIVK